MSSAIIRKIIFTSNAPKPAGPYSQAVLADRTLYVSGVIGIDPQTSSLVPGGTAEEFKQCMKNLGHVLNTAGTEFQNIVKTTIFLNNVEDFSVVNEIYKQNFSGDYPARSCFQVGKLPINANVEIEAIALVGCVETIPSCSY